MKHEFMSGLAPQMERFLEHKNALGYKYSTGSYSLRSLDRFCLHEGYGAMLTRQLVESWIIACEDKNLFQSM